MQESRVGNASRNLFFGMLVKGYQILLPFLMRLALMRSLGLDYLGLNSLFGSILWVLSLAELGVGSAMVYSMYQPIIDKDKEEICALLKLYRTYYRIIGIVIAVVGTALTPAVPYLIKGDVPADISVYVVYWLNLFCTVMSYWLFAYKNSLLVAHQRNDIASKVMLVTNTFQYAFQFLVVIVLKDYYIYLIVAIITQVLTNVIVAYYSSKIYPEYQPGGDLPKDRIRQINGRIKDLFTMKLGIVIVSSVDSIVVSAFFGLSVVAVYQNYNYILTAVMGIVKVVFDSCMSGIGNSILVDSKEKNYKDLKKLTFITAWLIGFCCVCLLSLFQPFMKIYAGEDALLSFSTVICFVVYFFVNQINQLFITYKDAAGIWHEDRFRPLVTAMVNLVLNLILVRVIGLYGVIFATVISILFVGMPWILHNLFTTLFKRNAKEYVLKLLYYTLVTVVVTAVTTWISYLVPDNGIPTIIIKLIICCIVSNILFLLAFFKTKEFGEAKEIVLRIIKR